MKKNSSSIFSYFIGFVSIFSMCSLFIRPEASFNGIFYGIKICYERIIPSLFPFLILSGLLMISPLANIVGFIFIPYTRILGIKSTKAATALLLGLMGGFAGASVIISGLVERGELSPSEASVLLCAAASSGPAFVISAVGYTMLGSSISGVFLFISLVLSNLITAFIIRFIFHPVQNSISHISENKKTSVAEVFQNSIASIISLCGYITAFCFFSAVFIPEYASQWIKYTLSAVMEVTIGCLEGSKMGSLRIYFVCGALSILGLCAYL